MSLAWHTAMLHRIEPKKFPKLKQLLKSTNARPAKQDWREQFAAVEAWVKAKGP